MPVNCNPGIFRETVFEGAASFEGSYANVSFDATEFREEVAMRGADFSGRSTFRLARFLGPVDFSDARFGEVVFDDAVFGEALFSRATFELRPSFARATFGGESSFGGTRFRENTAFERTRFLGEVKFDDADLRGITFRDCDLRGARLRNAFGVSEADFDGVAWRAVRVPRIWAASSLPRAARSRAMATVEGVIDEEDARTQDRPEVFAGAEHVYRELRRSAERQRRFGRANLFSVRELEMRRLAIDAGTSVRYRSELISLEAAYLHVSRYGQSVSKPLVWLALTLGLVFPHLFAWAGVTLNGKVFSLVPLGTPGNGGAYLELVTFSARTASLLPDPAGSSLELWAQLLQVALRVLGPFLGFLVALAVRSTFRR